MSQSVRVCAVTWPLVCVMSRLILDVLVWLNFCMRLKRLHCSSQFPSSIMKETISKCQSWVWILCGSFCMVLIVCLRLKLRHFRLFFFFSSSYSLFNINSKHWTINLKHSYFKQETKLFIFKSTKLVPKRLADDPNLSKLATRGFRAFSPICHGKG